MALLAAGSGAHGPYPGGHRNPHQRARASLLGRARPRPAGAPGRIRRAAGIHHLRIRGFMQASSPSRH